MIARLLALALFGFAAAACSAGADDGESPAASGVFLAMSEDFRGYHAFEQFDVTAEAPAAGIHDGSTVIEYINQLPGSGASAFPDRTIIVKESTGGTMGPTLFAMAKRGGGFNSGAPGWEWFELENLDDGADGVKIVWRGFGPPVGEKYGGDAEGGCNGCHGGCGDNDSVCSSVLRLTNF